MSTDIKEILHKNNLFKHLLDQEISSLCLEGTVKNYSANEIIIKEGEVGDILYVILSGNARVFTHSVNNEEINLTKLQMGDYFGEQALLTDKPLRRNASIQALTPVSVMTFTHEILQRCLKANKSLKILLEEHGQRQLITKLSKQLQDRSTKVTELFSLFEDVKHCSENEIIFRQGDQPDNAYLLLSGTVEIRIADANKTVKLASIIVPGQIFGEQAIIKQSMRAGTAVATSDAKLMVINGQALRDIYLKNSQLNILLGNLMLAYELPTLGLMTRYRGSFLGQSAIQSNVLKANGDMIVISHVPSANIFAMSYADGNKNVTKHHFQKSDDFAREIHIADDKLVGVISIGQWDDLVDVYRLLDAKIAVSDKILKNFQSSGVILGPLVEHPQDQTSIERLVYSK